ncbi:hypothetical protein [Verminephrobacter eiseniae]|uniref:hypothetical protein n=1 Tax=Verminephrobacter eiseniae TaxID=364317 RepID=UPI0010DCE1EE|nr:hypothetical protein [Verminephrobacter eiseniae]KAB7603411.1 hypothetical protein ET532_011635 [Verminephrobacter sp. Larva24]MCW5231919.1 hypothetical protein [Verminephrobacter eiseniae]MCW5293652.1 hypothetical protein [Verminephrobacter eiseniae]MCW8184309.1 hypothetical protein [Verminephrobacter eiseniae]MCW8225032.1 hypothetical protein [Verminephrobacter eiseniae]
MDHTSDPNAACYRIDPQRTDLAREFRSHIRGPYSQELQKLLHRMRWGPVGGRYLLYVLEPGRRWALAQMPPERGQKVRLFLDCRFDSLDAAEWHVFRLRWQALTGGELELDETGSERP